jgi:hypothetical protein
MYRRDRNSLEDKAHAEAVEYKALRHWVTEAWPGDDLPDHLIETFVQGLVETARRYEYRRNLHQNGVETRHGTHKRLQKLRTGTRLASHGESVTHWYVVDVPEGWLAAVKKRGAESAAEYDRYGYAEQEYVEGKLSELTEDEYGVNVYSTHNTADYSPTGRWFSSVYARQVGTRLLVEDHVSLDC